MANEELRHFVEVAVAIPEKAEAVLTILEENDVDLEVLTTMSEGDLEKLEISFGLRRKLTLAISKILVAKPHQLESAPDEVPVHHVSTSSDDNEGIPNPNSKRWKGDMNLTEAMKSSSEGRELMTLLDGGATLSSKQRKALVKITVTHLVDKHGLWPTAKQKTILAKEIVSTWPSTKDTTPGMEGHGHFFSPDGSGFIQYRLKNVRTAQQERMKCPKKNPKNKVDREPEVEVADVTGTEQQDIQEKIDWMKVSPPHHVNKVKHLQYFKDTHQYRRNAISHSESPLTIPDVFKMFPRYQDIPELIGLDFSMMYGKRSDNFINKWSSFREKIILLGMQEYETIRKLVESFKDANRDLCALSVVVYMLHRPMAKSKDGNCSRSDAIRYLIQNVPEGTNIEQAIREIKTPGFRQPLVVTLGSDPRNPKQFFVCLDNMPVNGGSSAVEAFDKLFKAFFVFGVDYPQVLNNFYDYFAAFVYEIWPTSKVKPLVRSFASSVKSVQ